MKRFFTGTWLALVIFLAPPWGAGAAEPERVPRPAASGHFLPPGAVDGKTVLPPPPAPGSIAALGDLETVLQVQAARTPADIAWAKLIEKDDYFADFGDVLGPWFDRKNLPGLADFLSQVTADAWLVSNQVKNLYPRQRPPAGEPLVQPCVRIPATNSYPSGHSLRAFVMAAVLGDIFPDRAAVLRERAHHVAWGRIMGGVHFPTDDVGGRIVAQAIVAELRKNPTYQAAVEQCRAEAAPFRLKPAA